VCRVAMVTHCVAAVRRTGNIRKGASPLARLSGKRRIQAAGVWLGLLLWRVCRGYKWSEERPQASAGGRQGHGGQRSERVRNASSVDVLTVGFGVVGRRCEQCTVLIATPQSRNLHTQVPHMHTHHTQRRRGDTKCAVGAVRKSLHEVCVAKPVDASPGRGKPARGGHGRDALNHRRHPTSWNGRVGNCFVGAVRAQKRRVCRGWQT